jgi:hypothetical protein
MGRSLSRQQVRPVESMVAELEPSFGVGATVDSPKVVGDQDPIAAGRRCTGDWRHLRPMKTNGSRGSRALVSSPRGGSIGRSMATPFGLSFNLMPV